MSQRHQGNPHTTYPTKYSSGYSSPSLGSSFGTAAFGAAGAAIGGPIGAGLGQAIGGALFGGGSSQPNYAEQVQLGHKYDRQSQQQYFRWMHKYGKKHGMTDYEMFMGPAGGQSGGSTGAGATLGNAANQQEMQQKQIYSAASTEAINRELDRQNAVKIAQINADTQRDVAEIGYKGKELDAETTLTVEEWRNAIANRQVTLSEKEYQEITKPLAAKNLSLKEWELELLTNQVATSTPEWERWRLMQQMGVDNMLVSAISNRLGINVTNQKQMQDLSEEQFDKLITLALSAQSHTRKETEGIVALLREFAGDGGDSQVDPVSGSEVGRGASAGAGASNVLGGAGLPPPRTAPPSGKYRGSSFTAPDRRRRRY